MCGGVTRRVTATTRGPGVQQLSGFCRDGGSATVARMGGTKRGRRMPWKEKPGMASKCMPPRSATPRAGVSRLVGPEGKCKHR